MIHDKGGLYEFQNKNRRAAYEGNHLYRHIRSPGTASDPFAGIYVPSK